jgi:predicted CxxxxCH...CXXCH cytochrome family protein
VQGHANGDASTDLIHFDGIALSNAAGWLSDAGSGAAPAWDPQSQRCTNTYCHGPTSPPWTTSTPIACSGCHGAPPPDHARWQRVASDPSTCTACHPSPASATHIDGTVNVTVTDCATCHGSNGHSNPPVSLGGSTDPTTRGVGAHAAHLDPSAPNRIANPLLCNDCHLVPTAVVQVGHFDAPSAQVRFPFGGTYDATNATCSVWCHFDKTPGPRWTDDTGAATHCDSCHAFPPVLTRQGTPHPSVAGELSACLRCHVYGVSTHVNGVVDFVPP